MTSDVEDVARRFFGAYADGELETARLLLATDVTAYITNAEAGVDRVQGRDAYMSRVPDLQAAGGSLRVTQLLVIDAETVLTMVEIHARRSDTELHNFAAFLARVRNGQIAELWMVEAKPAYSDEFWA